MESEGVGEKDDMFNDAVERDSAIERALLLITNNECVLGTKITSRSAAESRRKNGKNRIGKKVMMITFSSSGGQAASLRVRRQKFPVLQLLC